MNRLSPFVRTLALPAIALLTAAPIGAQTRDHAPSSLKSSPKMTQDEPGGESWTYAQHRLAFSKCRTIIIDPTTVYDGPDAKFEGIDSADRAKLADMFTDGLRSEVAKSFPEAIIELRDSAD